MRVCPYSLDPRQISNLFCSQRHLRHRICELIQNIYFKFLLFESFLDGTNKGRLPWSLLLFGDRSVSKR